MNIRDFITSAPLVFRCRIVPTGERYGHELSLINNKEPMIEFYDARYRFDYLFHGSRAEAIAAGAPCLGQFVTRCYISTFRESRSKERGICLDGSNPDWNIDAGTMRQIHDWLDAEMPERSDNSSTPFALAIRLTHGYTIGWSHLDKWIDLGTAQIIKVGKRREDCDSFRQIQIVKVDAPGFRPRNVMRALHDAMSFGCRCEHDCCGHLFGGPSRIRPLGKGSYAVLISGHRNV